MKEYDNWLDRTHDEAYEAHYGSDDYFEECDVCFGGVDW